MPAATLVMRFSLPGAPTETVFGTFAIEPGAERNRVRRGGGAARTDRGGVGAGCACAVAVGGAAVRGGRLHADRDRAGG